MSLNLSLKSSTKRREHPPQRVALRLLVSFDDDADEFLFPRAEEKFGGLAQVDVFARIVDGRAVDFYCLLFDEAFGFRFRWCHLQVNEQSGELSGGTYRQLFNGGINRRLAVAENALEIFGGFTRSL